MPPIAPRHNFAGTLGELYVGTLGELLADVGIGTKSLNPGNHRSACPLPACEGHKGDAVSISIKDGKAIWKCHRCGWAGCRSVNSEAKSDRPVKREAPKSSPAYDRSLIDWLIDRIGPIERTPVATYLRSRGLELPPPGHHLRYLPPMPPRYPWPCMIGLITDLRDHARILSLHFTRLKLDGTGKAPGPQPRSFLKGFSKKGGVIRLCADDDVELRLGIGEGIETALSVMTAFRRDEGRLEPVWSALDAGNMAELPVPGGIETLAIYADRGDAGERAAEKLAQRWLAADREVFTFTAPADDWNPKAAA